MKKVLCIVNTGQISSNTDGGSSVIYSHLELLHRLKYEVVLLAVSWNDKFVYQEEDYLEVKEFVSKIVPHQIEKGKRKRGLDWVYHAFVKPTEFEYFFVNKVNTDFLQDFVQKETIDFVWCEWRWAAIWALKTPLNVPKIYSHHDWEHKLALLRESPSLNRRFHSFQKKRVEIEMVKTMDACISGSETETKEIESISKKKALYLPTTYTSTEVTLNPNKYPSLVHLGGMGTTANRLGLERFLDVCWNDLKKEIPNIQLKIIGNLERAQDSLKSKLEDEKILKLGFVEDLTTVLYPEDIHIVPWEYNTGTRTRIPVVLNHQQVLVATKESVRCFSELNSENSILCEDLNEMKDQIIHLYSDREKLHLLAAKGKETFQNAFTSESQQNRLKDFLKTIHL